MDTIHYAGSWGETIDVASPWFKDSVHQSCVLSALHWIVSKGMKRTHDSSENLENNLDKKEARGYFKIIRNKKEKMG